MGICVAHADRHTHRYTNTRADTRTDRHGGTDGSPHTSVAPTHTHERNTGFVIDPPNLGIRYFSTHSAYDLKPILSVQLFVLGISLILACTGIG